MPNDSMRGDIAEMEHMLDEYLSFARGEGGEDAALTDLGVLVQDAATAAGKARTARRRSWSTRRSISWSASAAPPCAAAWST